MRDLLAETKYLLKSYGLSSVHSLGQNFLIDEKVLNKIVESANITKDDNVVEIGPGLGILTNELVKQANKVLAIELDKRLLPVLKKINKVNDNLIVINEDILKIKNQDIIDIFKTGNYRVVANIPYQITSLIIKKFLADAPKPKDIIIMIQKEVAQRIVAKPGQLSLLAISVQLYGQPKIIDIVAKDCFYPVPKVDSAIVEIKISNYYITILNKAGITEKNFWAIVRSGFSSKRKTLVNNLSNSLHKDRLFIEGIFENLKIDKKIRAQNLTLEQWIDLTKLLNS